VVPATGLEPIDASFLMFSSVLIIAFLCANLYAKIQALPSYCKHCFASLCNYGQKNLCGIVRLCGNCAAVKFCAGTVRLPSAPLWLHRAGLPAGLGWPWRSFRPAPVAPCRRRGAFRLRVGCYGGIQPRRGQGGHGLDFHPASAMIAFGRARPR
jgi:hypothetical protein